VKRPAEGWKGWDEYAAFYDWENAQTVQRRDVRFWEQLAIAAEGPVLELGCGTGRISVPVARRGATLVGIDRSEPMLARARKKLRRGRLERAASLVLGDIRHLPFRRHRFELVMAPYGILQSLTREEDLRATLESVARVLRRGGRFAIDLVPDLPKWSEYEARRTLQGKLGRLDVSLVESVHQDRARTTSPGGERGGRSGASRSPSGHSLFLKRPAGSSVRDSGWTRCSATTREARGTTARTSG
jgi:SAM-dependent methyltransferase